jgi:hypothetical protein
VHSPALLPSVYFGPVAWYSNFLFSENVAIDRHENYIRQTWRNRCRILGPNGIQDLVVPVHAPNHTPLENVRIDYRQRWQQQHWGAIRAGYGQSPYFEYYAEKLEHFFIGEEFDLLVDLNAAILATTLKLMKSQKEWKFSESFHPYSESDPRLILHPKKKSPGNKSYAQVFGERHGFVPGLSVIDLLFCCGPASSSYLL